MLRSEKKTCILELEEIYKSSESLIVIHYHGLTVLELTNLRLALKENNTHLKIVKNTLSKIAMSNVNMNTFPEVFSGPTAIAYSNNPVAAAKTIVHFAKTNSNLKIVGAIVNDNILDLASIQQLAKLPSLDQLRGKIIGILQTPASNVTRVIQTPSVGLARILQAYVEKNNSK